MTKLENGKRINEGVCITCAKELGLPLDNLLGDYMSKMGITSDQIAEMEEEMAEMLSSDGLDGSEEGPVPAIDLKNMFRQAGLMSVEENGGENKPEKATDKKEAGEGKKQRAQALASI